jgi:hypothetical protein
MFEPAGITWTFYSAEEYSLAYRLYMITHYIYGELLAERYKYGIKPV